MLCDRPNLVFQSISRKTGVNQATFRLALDFHPHRVPL